MKSSSRRHALLLAPHSLWCVLFIIVPMLFVVYYAFTDVNGAFTLENLLYIARPDSGYLRSFFFSVLYALGATLICLLIGYPIALFISRLPERRRQFLLMLIMVPMWVSFIIRTYTILNIFEDNGIINAFLTKIGLNSVRFTGTPGLVLFGMVYDFLPYMVVPICNVLSGIDRKYPEAAADLGCNSSRVFTKVFLPLSVSGIVSGITMVFVPAISTFYIASTLSGGKIALIGDKIETAFLSNADAQSYRTGAALSLILMILILASMFIVNRFGDGESEECTI